MLLSSSTTTSLTKFLRNRISSLGQLPIDDYDTFFFVSRELFVPQKSFEFFGLRKFNVNMADSSCRNACRENIRDHLSTIYDQYVS